MTDKSPPSISPMKFDDAMIEIPVKVGNRNYVLREASGRAAKTWQNFLMNGVKLVDGKPSSMGNIAGSQPLLVSLCLFYADENGEVQKVKDSRSKREIENRVDQDTIESWPAKVVKDLFEKVKEISELDEDEEANKDKAGNEQDDTTGGS